MFLDCGGRVGDWWGVRAGRLEVGSGSGKVGVLAVDIGDC